MITNFKIYEQSELTQFSDLTKMNVYVKTASDLTFIVTDKADKENDYEENFPRNVIRFLYNLWDDKIGCDGEPSDYFNLDKYTKYNYDEFYKIYKEYVIVIYKDLQEKDIENIGNSQQYDAFVLLRDFLEQIEEIKTIRNLSKYRI